MILPKPPSTSFFMPNTLHMVTFMGRIGISINFRTGSLMVDESAPQSNNAFTYTIMPVYGLWIHTGSNGHEYYLS